MEGVSTRQRPRPLRVAEEAADRGFGLERAQRQRQRWTANNCKSRVEALRSRRLKQCRAVGNCSSMECPANVTRVARITHLLGRHGWTNRKLYSINQRQHASMGAHIVKHVVAQTRRRWDNRCENNDMDNLFDEDTGMKSHASHSTARIWRAIWLNRIHDGSRDVKVGSSFALDPERCGLNPNPPNQHPTQHSVSANNLS